MRFASFSTSTPKPRAEGSSPSAPAKESRRSNCFFGFLLWAKMALNCGTRSVRRGAGRQWRPFSVDRAGRRDKSLLAQFWALFSHLAASVSTASVWYIIKRASLFRRFVRVPGLPLAFSFFRFFFFGSCGALSGLPFVDVGNFHPLHDFTSNPGPSL